MRRMRALWLLPVLTAFGCAGGATVQGPPPRPGEDGFQDRYNFRYLDQASR